MFPGFLGIGAQKAGTTWLHAVLSRHTEIWLPHLKELHYFDRKFPIGQRSDAPKAQPGRGIVARQVSTRVRRINFQKLKHRLSFRRWGDLGWEVRYMLGDWTDEWYASLFDGARGRLAGDITPAYACLGEAAIAHIHGLMPDARLILLLRDPIDRAWSHAKMDLTRRGHRDASEIPDDEYLAHFHGPASRARGDYVASIQRWLGVFPEKQLFLGFYDEILDCPEDLIRRICAFLEVSADDPNLSGGLRARVNPGAERPIPPRLHRVLALLYIDELGSLASRYGTYPVRWLRRCEATLGGG